jgi:hypothetical protein
MKYIIIFFLISTAAIVMPNMVGKAKQSPAETAVDSTKLSPDSVISTAWFDTNLDIYIPQEYIPFNPLEYKHALTKGMKDTLGFEYWLGTFTISDMFNENGYTMIDFSKENHKKIMFITPTYFVLTSYMKADKSTGLTYGSSLIYYPKENVLKELEHFIVFEVYGDKLDGAFEHYQLEEEKYIEYGQYGVHDGSFTLAE